MKYQKIDSPYIWKKKYLNRFMAGMIGFGIMMPFVIFIGKKVQTGIPLQILIALLPVIPLFLAMSAYIKNFRNMDEMWKKIHTEALITTAIITIGLSFSLGMIQVMNIIGPFSIFYLFPFMMVTWSLCFAYFHVKYNGIENHEE